MPVVPEKQGSGIQTSGCPRGEYAAATNDKGRRTQAELAILRQLPNGGKGFEVGVFCGCATAGWKFGFRSRANLRTLSKSVIYIPHNQK